MPIKEDRLQTEARRVRRLQKLGDNPSCSLCGETRPECLIRTKRSILEVHHVAGEANDSDMTIVLCLNHHALATEKQREFAVDLSRQKKTKSERAINILKGLASFFVLVIESLLELAKIFMEESEIQQPRLPEAT